MKTKGVQQNSDFCAGIGLAIDILFPFEHAVFILKTYFHFG